MDQLASHGLFDVTVEAQGDTWIDDHHTNEDIALALGTALAQALGDRKGIHRFGDFTGGGWRGWLSVCCGGCCRGCGCVGGREGCSPCLPAAGACRPARPACLPAPLALPACSSPG